MAKLLVVKLNQFSDEPEGRRCGVLYVHVCCTSGASKLSIASHLRTGVSPESMSMAWHARVLLSDSA